MDKLSIDQSKDIVVDFVAEGESSSDWLMVLVEKGPVIESLSDYLSQLQEKLYSCIDAAIDGNLAEKFPESAGKNIIIRVDCRCENSHLPFRRKER